MQEQRGAVAGGRSGGDAAASAGQFHYVVIGAGAAGCVLANRLSADPGIRVALIEAGGRDRNALIYVPAGVAGLIGHRDLDWGYKTTPQTEASQRRIPLPRGRVLVFSSGNRPALGRPTPWMAGPYAEQISASLAKWESEDSRDQRVTETESASAEARLAELNDHILRDERLASSMTSEGVLL